MNKAELAFRVAPVPRLGHSLFCALVVSCTKSCLSPTLPLKGSFNLRPVYGFFFFYLDYHVIVIFCFLLLLLKQLKN